MPSIKIYLLFTCHTIVYVVLVVSMGSLPRPVRRENDGSCFFSSYSTFSVIKSES